MKKLILCGSMVSMLFSFSCSLTLPGSKKGNSNSVNLGLLGLAMMNAETSFVLVPNSDTTKPFLSVIKHNSGTNTFVSNVTLDTNPSDSSGTANDHIFSNLTNSNKVAVLNINGAGARLTKYIDVGSRPVHIYQDPAGKIWVMNDGNSGIDNITTSCNAASVGSVSVIQDGAKGAADADSASLLKTFCVGKGHHKAIFTSNPKRAFVSSITDNTISVIDNDPTSASYLTVIGTLNLGTGAGPHGFSYSSKSDKVYISAQTAGTVIAVNPSTLATETIATTKSGPSSSSPDGQYIALPGKDTTTDTNHVIGKVTILNATTHAFVTLNVNDVSTDHMMFSADGKRLYVASALAGTGNQITNLKQNVLLVYDSSNLPNLTYITEVVVGDAKAGNRHIAGTSHGSMTHLFVPAGTGVLSTVDSTTNSVSQSIDLTGSFSNAFFHTLGAAPSHAH